MLRLARSVLWQLPVVWLVLVCRLAAAQPTAGDPPADIDRLIDRLGAKLSAQPETGWWSSQPAAAESTVGDPLAGLDLTIDQLGAQVSVQPETGWWPARLPLGGYLESRNQLRFDTIGEPVSLRQRVWLELPLGYGPFRAFVSGLAEAEAAAGLTDHGPQLFRAELREAYLLWDTSRLDITLGQKLVRWGVTDGVNTMDLINPVDSRDPLANARTSRRLPIPLVEAELALGGFIVEGVFIPRAEVSQLPGFGDPWQPAGLRRLRRAARDGAVVFRIVEPHAPEFALRLTTYRSGYDFGLSYYNGFTDSAVFTGGLAADGRPRITARYPHFVGYGLNFAVGLAQSTLRGELAYKPAFPFSTTDGRIATRPYLQAVLGWDRTFLRSLYVNLQAFSDHVFGARPTLGQDANGYGLTFSIGDKFFRDDLDAGLRGLYGINDSGLALELFGAYALGDHWKIDAGVLLFEGQRNSGAGVFDRNDLFYVRTAYVF